MTQSDLPGRAEPQPGQPTLKRQLSQAVAWNAAFTPLKFIIDTIANLIKVNLLTPAELGTISLVSSAASTAGTWLDLGIEQGLPKFIPEAEQAGGRGAARRFLRYMLSLKMVIMVLGLLALPLWGGAVLEQIREGAYEQAAELGVAAVGPLLQQLEQYSWVFLATIAALIVLGAWYDTLLAYLVSFFRQKAWNIINAFATLALPLLTVIAVLFGWGVVGVLGAMVVTAVLSVLVTWHHVRRISAARPNEAAEKPIPRDLWRRFVPYTAIAFFIGGTEYFSSAYFVALVIGADDLADVALFWVAYNFIRQIRGYVYTPLQGIQVPLFARVRGEHGQQLGRVFATLARLVLVLVVPSAIGLALLLPNLILIQFKAEYVQSIGIGLVLIPFFFTEPFWGLGHNLLMVHEDYKPVLISRCCALISIPLLIILPPLWGLAGIAVAIGVSKMVAGLVVVGAAMQRYGVRFPWRFAAKTILAGAAMGAVIGCGVIVLGTIPLAASIATRLIYFGACLGLTLVGVMIFVLMARLLKLIEAEDRELLNELRNPLARRLVRVL